MLKNILFACFCTFFAFETVLSNENVQENSEIVLQNLENIEKDGEKNKHDEEKIKNANNLVQSANDFAQNNSDNLDNSDNKLNPSNVDIPNQIDEKKTETTIDGLPIIDDVNEPEKTEPEVTELEVTAADPNAIDINSSDLINNLEEEKKNHQPLDALKNKTNDSQNQTSSSKKIVIRMTCRSKGKELDLCQKAIDEWTKKTGHKVEIISLPHSSNECFALYQQWLCAKSLDVDILQMDIAWVGVLSNFLYDLTPYVSENILSDFFDEIKKTIILNGHLLAMPWYTDAGMLFYRKDLLEKYGYKIPQSMEDIFEIAEKIQLAEKKIGNYIYGFVYQAKAQEILVCNFFEFLDAFGGKILDDENNVVINSKNSVNALNFMRKCIDKKVTPIGILNYTEEEARGVFQSGKAVFMRNWPYAWSLVNQESSVVCNKVGVMSIPSSKALNKKTAALGGWHLCVSKYTKHPKEAIDLLLFLTSKSQQKNRAIIASYAPAYKSLYRSKKVLISNPFYIDLYYSLQNAVKRPFLEFNTNYPRFSSHIFNFVHNILSVKNLDADILNDNLIKIENCIKLLKKSECDDAKEEGGKVDGLENCEKVCEKRIEKLVDKKVFDKNESMTFFDKIINWFCSFF